MSPPTAGFTDGDDVVTLADITEDVKAGDGHDHITILDEDYVAAFSIFGELGSDTLIGGQGRDRLFGGDGSDHLVGNEDDDTLAGDGNDRSLNGGAGDLLEGGDGQDRLFGGDASAAASPRFSGLSYEFDYVDNSDFLKPTGDDTLFGGDGFDTLIGFDGDDLLYGGGFADVIFGGAGADSLYGDDASDEISAGSGDDFLYGGASNDTLKGDADDDVLFGGSGTDELFGGLGDDTIYADADDLNSLVSLNGALRGNEGDDLLSFRFAASTANGAGFDIAMVQYADFETFEGSQFDDTVQSNIVDVMGAGGDDLIISNGAFMTVDGGAGFDEVSYRNSSSGVTVALDAAQRGWAAHGKGGDAEGDTLTGVESIDASNHVDVLYGDGAENSLRGRQANDSLFGGEGWDTLLGNQGDDLLSGGAGGDRLEGGVGTDTATYRDSKYGVFIQLDAANGGYGLRGDAHLDKLISIENLIGSYVDDHLRGDATDNRLEGSFGADTLDGGEGDDTLIGAQGDDTLTGGDGADAFVFNADYHTGDDVITDFETGMDRIEIYGDAEVEVIEGENGVEIVIQGKSQGVLTVESVWDVDLMLMG